MTIRRAAVAVVGLAAIVAAAVRWSGHPVATVGLGGYLAALAVLAEIDLAQHRLPNRLVGPLAGATTLWLATAGIAAHEPGRAVRAVAMGLAVSAALLALALLADVGMGDVKLSFPVAMVAAWLGAGAGWATMLVVALTASSAAMVAIARGRRRSHLPMGPFMALGAAAGVLVAVPR